MNGCDKESVLAWLESIRRGESAACHPFVERFIREEELRKAASFVSVLSKDLAGETVFLPSSLLPPLD